MASVFLALILVLNHKGTVEALNPEQNAGSSSHTSTHCVHRSLELEEAFFLHGWIHSISIGVPMLPATVLHAEGTEANSIVPVHMQLIT